MDNGDGRIRSMVFDEVQADVGFRFARREIDALKEAAIRLSRGALQREVLAVENPGMTFPPPNAISEQGAEGSDGVYALWTGSLSGDGFDYGTFASPKGSIDYGYFDAPLVALDHGRF